MNAGSTAEGHDPAYAIDATHKAEGRESLSNLFVPTVTTEKYQDTQDKTVHTITTYH